MNLRAPTRPSVSFLDGGGELGALMRSHPWQDTPLGPPASWPRSLKTAVRILLTSRQPFWLGWGPDLTFLYNDPYKAIIGGKHPTALGRPFREVWLEIWDVVGPMAHHVMTRDEGTYVEAQRLIMQRHGYQEETYYTFSYSPVPDDDGRPGGLICANTDDTRRVIGERQLAALRELAARTALARSWREACTLALDALATDVDDLPYALLFVTDGPLTLAGATPAAPMDVPDWPLDEVLASSIPRTVEVESGPTWRVVLWPLSASQTGRRGVLAIGISPIRVFDEGYRGFLELVVGGVASAIANGEAYELERARAEALAELDRAKTAFFSNVSHEFRTPLTLVLGPIEQLLDDASLGAEHHEALALVRRSALRLQKLVNTLLDFSRIEAGRMQASFEPTALGPITRELASLFRSTVEGAGLAMRIDVAADLPVVHVDRDMWEKIVLNLVSNAFKFTFDGAIGVSLCAGADGVVLEVQDTGTGIPEAELPHLFERFRRVQGARGRSIEGSGIGLALVQELVRMHGGTVSVRSELERGSTFTVTLPAGVAHLPADRLGTGSSPQSVTDAHLQDVAGWAAAPQPIRAPAPDGRPRILLADDNADVRDYLGGILAAQYDVEAVGDGLAALEAARSRIPAMIVTDAIMPGLDGFGLLRELRADERLATVPVLMLSARAGEEARIDGIVAGADDYLVKPFSARELLARIASRIELTRLRERLREERALVSNLFAQMPVPIAVLRGSDLTFELANPAYQRTVGGRDVVGLPYLEAMPEIADEGHRPLLLQVLEAGEPWFGEELPARFDRDGDGRLEDSWWSFVVAPLRGPDGQTDGVVTICTDVTERVLGRRAIERSEARFRSIFESAGVAILEVDLSDLGAVRLIDANPASRRMFGADDARPLPAEIGLVLAEARDTLGVGLASLSQGRPFVTETAVRRLDGERIDVLLTLSRATADVDRAANVLITLVDITARRRAEVVLQEEAETHELLNRIGATLAGDLDLNRIVQAVTEAATAASGAQRGVFVTARAELSVGVPVAGLTWLGERGVVRVSAVLAGAAGVRVDDLGDGEPMRSLLAVPVLSRSGERLGGLVLAHPRPEAFTERAERRVGGMAYQAAVAMDNALLHEQRQALIAQLRESDRRKDEFLATLSHELRNPLAPLRNALHLLRLGDAGSTPVRAMMERQVEHLVRLVDDLLEVSRINRGRIELRVERIELGAVVRHAVEAIEPLVASGGHRLVLALEEPAWVDGDPVRIAQILTNLLSNAAKYSLRGTIEVRLAQGEGEAIVVVRDDGVGISAGALPHLFEMFSRGDQASGRGPGGLGVGLALARRLADVHGGTLTAHSEGPGRGSEFTLRLPQVDGTDAVAPVPGVTAVDRRRVLVVDDNADAADSLAMLLEALGADVRVAHHGRDALAAYPAFRPAMVLLDIGMPDLDGYAVARAMRADHPQVRATIVALSGWGQEEDRRRAREAGFDHHLIKPADLAEIERLLGALTAW